MHTINFTEFRKKASFILSAVEKGETFIVLRHGQPVAEISPVTHPDSAPSWKQPALRLSITGASLSSAILEERERENVL
ncbi:MAG: type II toxin-antitoxin system Phd/YefM family antitoxin [Pseudomonadota bacterium]